MAISALVTGGTGFLGKGVLEALQEKHPDWSLHCLDIKPGEISHGIVYEEADITSKHSIDAVFARVKPDVVVHTAGIVPSGQTRYSNKQKDRDGVFAVNVTGTQNVLDAAKEHGCKAFVHTSSCTVVSDDMLHDYPNMDETIPLGNATLSYGSSKAAAEKIVLDSNGENMATCALRPATIIGPGDSFGVIATIHCCIRNGETPYIIGDGNNMYDFVYISNVVDAHVLAVENLLSTKTAAGEAFFISNQEPIYFRDFMVAIWAEFGHVPPFQVCIPQSLAWIAGYIAEWTSWYSGSDAALSRGSVNDAVGIRYSNNAKAVRILDYKPKVRFAAAVKLACVDYKRILAEKSPKGATIKEMNANGSILNGKVLNEKLMHGKAMHGHGMNGHAVNGPALMMGD